jgi:CNT family concentrative nucleoside transporter
MNALWLLQELGQQLAQTREGVEQTVLARLVGVVGIATMIVIAWLLSKDRRRVNWRLVGSGVALQVVFGVLVLKTGVGRALFKAANAVFIKLLGFTEEGARFIFGNLVKNNVPVGPVTQAPADMAPIQSVEMWANTGSYFAFSVLPTIIFFSSLMTVLYYLGLMQRIVQGIAWVMQRTMGTSGAETLSVAGNIFVGQTEAPLLIRPFVGKMTYSELDTVMVALPSPVA